MMSNFGSMGGLGKNMRMDTNAMNNEIKKNSIKERLRERLEKKRQAQAQAAAQAEVLAKMAAQANPKSEPESFVFRVDGEKQQTSSRIPPKNNITYSLDNEADIDKLVNELQITNDDIANPNKGASGSNKKKKKSKK